MVMATVTVTVTLMSTNALLVGSSTGNITSGPCHYQHRRRRRRFVVVGCKSELLPTNNNSNDHLK